jgi:hypothetical protein
MNEKELYGMEEGNGVRCAVSSIEINEDIGSLRNNDKEMKDQIELLHIRQHDCTYMDPYGQASARATLFGRSDEKHTPSRRRRTKLCLRTILTWPQRTKLTVGRVVGGSENMLMLQPDLGINLGAPVGRDLRWATLREAKILFKATMQPRSRSHHHHHRGSGSQCGWLTLIVAGCAPSQVARDLASHRFLGKGEAAAITSAESVFFLDTGSFRPAPSDRHLQTGTFRPAPSDRHLQTGTFKPHNSR